MIFKNSLIIGLGLIGGSFARAMKQSKVSAKITACDFDEESLDLAKIENVIDEGFVDLQFLSDDLAKFDLIVIATPLSAYEEIFANLKNKISEKTLVIDLGSIKNFQFKDLPKNFVPCHPIAGLEVAGYENSTADLFKGKKFIICKENQKIVNLITEIGAKAEFIEVKKHDEIYALVSHLPQFLSFLSKEFSPKNIKNEFLQKAFRLDNSDPEIWEDIFAMNEENLEKFYLKFFDNLEKNCFKKPEELLLLMQSVSDKKAVLSNIDFDEISKNFDKILPRLAIVLSYLQIPEIKKYSSYAGSGFKDFTAIIAIANCDHKKIISLISISQKELQKLLKLLS